MSEDTHTLLSLRHEVKALRFMIVLMVTFMLAGLMLGNLHVLFQIPRMEKIYEEMLGSRDKLPMLTKWIISYSRLSGMLLPLALVTVVPVSTCVIYIISRKTLWAQAMVATIILMLILHWIVIAFALQTPLLQIIQGINEAM